MAVHGGHLHCNHSIRAGRTPPVRLACRDPTTPQVQPAAQHDHSGDAAPAAIQVSIKAMQSIIACQDHTCTNHSMQCGAVDQGRSGDKLICEVCVCTCRKFMGVPVAANASKEAPDSDGEATTAQPTTALSYSTTVAAASLHGLTSAQLHPDGQQRPALLLNPWPNGEAAAPQPAARTLPASTLNAVLSGLPHNDSHLDKLPKCVWIPAGNYRCFHHDEPSFS